MNSKNKIFSTPMVGIGAFTGLAVWGISGMFLGTTIGIITGLIKHFILKQKNQNSSGR